MKKCVLWREAQFHAHDNKAAMGVKGLWGLLKPVGKNTLLESLDGKILAIGMDPSALPLLPERSGADWLVSG